MNEDGLEIGVEYCVPCSYLSRTMWLVGDVLTDLQEDIKSLTLVPSSSGRFEWTVDGELVYSKAQTDRFPDLDELKMLVANKL